MPLESMTGFARSDANISGVSIVWELKSVNGKSLDIRLRLPPGWDRLEPIIRQKFQAGIQRGSIQAGLTIDTGAAAGKLVVNEALIEELAALATRLAGKIALSPPSIADLLAIRGVAESAEPVPGEELEALILSALDRAISGLKSARASEGAALQTVLARHVNAIEKLTLTAEADPSRQPQAIRARIVENIALLTGASPALDESRTQCRSAFHRHARGYSRGA